MIFENVRNNIRDFIRLLVGSTDNDFEEDVIISNHLSMLIASHLDIFDTVSYCVDRKIKKLLEALTLRLTALPMLFRNTLMSTVKIYLGFLVTKM